MVKALPIKDFYGYYITDTGDVYSRKHDKKGRVKKLSTKISVGYPMVCLCKNGKMFYKRIHRLVAEAFIKNIENKPEINHIDGNRKNNNVSNLEWCSQSENMKHSYRILGQKKGMLGKCGILHHSSKIIQQIKNNVVIKEFYGSGEAQKETNICARNIRKVCSGERNTAGGFQWKYK